MLHDIVATFESALGPFADSGVVALARELPETLARPEDLCVLMQVERRLSFRTRPALLTVVDHRLTLTTAGGAIDAWPVSDCAVVVGSVRLAGMRMTIRAGGGSRALHRAMPVDESSRLADILSRDDSAGDGPSPCSRHPPVARLGAAATLYDDRIAFGAAPTRMLVSGVTARTLELGSPTTLRSVSRLMQGARGRPRHVLVDGPGWSQVAPAPETAPELADAFAAAVNRWAAAV